jgi:hypothetical protein
MKFWLVSRETLEEVKSSRDRLIERLEKEILELKEDRKVTVDILSVRALGVPIYGKIKPPVEDEPDPEPETRPTEDGQPAPIQSMPLSGRARAIAQARSATNLEQYSKDQAELMRLVEQAKEEGRIAAEAAPTNGNGSHS